MTKATGDNRKGTLPAAIITGASRGIGAAVAQRLATTGTAVTITARSMAGLRAVADSITASGGSVLPVAADAGVPEDCQRVVAETEARWGGVDALVNNAGTVEPVGSIAQADVAAWRRALTVNLFGPFTMTRYALKALRRSGGRVVNISSGAAERAIWGASAYCTAKAGLNHFTRVLAAEEPAIVAVALRPGMVDTQMQAVIRQQGPPAMPSAEVAFYRDAHRNGQLLAPEVPAAAIAWLARFAPPSMTGSFLDYDDPRIAGPAAEVFTAHGAPS